MMKSVFKLFYEKNSCKLIYRKAYKYYQCENCMKPYPKDFIEECATHQYRPKPYFCMNCGFMWK